MRRYKNGWLRLWGMIVSSVHGGSRLIRLYACGRNQFFKVRRPLASALAAMAEYADEFEDEEAAHEAQEGYS